MAKKQSFGDKVKQDSDKEKFTNVKYIRSVISDKTGKNRFVESMYKIPSSQSIDSFLKEVDSPSQELAVDELKVDKPTKVNESENIKETSKEVNSDDEVLSKEVIEEEKKDQDELKSDESSNAKEADSSKDKSSIKVEKEK